MAETNKQDLLFNFGEDLGFFVIFNTNYVILKIFMMIM